MVMMIRLSHKFTATGFVSDKLSIKDRPHVLSHAMLL